MARLNTLLELTAPFVKVGGAVLALKGAAAQEELDEAKGAIQKLGLKLEAKKTFPIDGAGHTVLVLRKNRSHTVKIPQKIRKNQAIAAVISENAPTPEDPLRCFCAVEAEKGSPVCGGELAPKGRRGVWLDGVEG